MVVPLVVAGLGGLALSGGANLYSQWNTRKLYRRQINAYSKLQEGYSRYLAKHGRVANPYRMYERYGSHIDSSSVGLHNSYAGSIGTLAGTIGSGSVGASYLMRAPKTRKWL